MISMALTALSSKPPLNSADLSSKKNGTHTSALSLLYWQPNYSENVSSYASACQEDPELKTFDSSLRQRTNELFRSVAAQQGNTEYPFLNSLTQVSQFLTDQYENVAINVIGNKADFSNDEELNSLIDSYFKATNNALKLFNTIEKCVNKAKKSLLVIRVAIKQFETESMVTDLGGSKKNKKYTKTLEQLNKFLAMEDPFGDEFATELASVQEEHEMLFKKFCKLQKRENFVNKCKTFVQIGFATAVVCLVALSLISLGSPLLIASSFKLIPLTIATGAWVSNMLEDYENVLKEKKKLYSPVKQSTKVNIEALNTIKRLVEKLSESLEAIRDLIGYTKEEEEEVMILVKQEIIDKVKDLSEKIKEVGDTAPKCSKSIALGRTRVVEHLANYVKR